MKKKDKKKNRSRQAKIGIDFGKVIMGATINGVADTSFLGTSVEEAIHSEPTPGALSAVTQLVSAFHGHAWIISKCGPSVQAKTRAWLKHWDFYSRTGLPKENLRFCRKRHEKAPICKQLRITHFIDDRVDVLEPMLGIVPNLYLFGESKRMCPKWAIPARTWPELLEQMSIETRNARSPQAQAIVSGCEPGPFF